MNCFPESCLCVTPETLLSITPQTVLASGASVWTKTVRLLLECLQQDCQDLQALRHAGDAKSAALHFSHVFHILDMTFTHIVSGKMYCFANTPELYPCRKSSVYVLFSQLIYYAK